MGYGQFRRFGATERRELPRNSAEPRSSRGVRRGRRARRLLLERLETRQLLAAVPEVLADMGLAGDLWSREFTSVGDTVYFSDGGTDLWKSGGTPASTEKITTITHPDLSESAGITDFVDAGGVLAFVVFDYGSDSVYTDDHRVQFWKSDGTPGGTVMVADLGLGSTLPADSGDAHLTAVGGRVFGVVSTPAAGYELWVSDLNPANPSGTHLVEDLFPGMSSLDPTDPNSSYPSDLLAFGGQLYFAADDGQHGTELWVSDGTAVGTQMVKDIVSSPTAVGSYPTDLTLGNGEFFFGALNPGADFNPSTGADNRVELWKSNGTGGGTVRVHQFAVGTSPPSGLDGDPQLTYLPETGKLFGVVEFPDGVARSQDLICWDGSIMHHWNLNPGGDDWVGNLSPAFGLLGFAADDGVNGREPWLSDGDSTNALGTYMIKDIAPGDSWGLEPEEVGLGAFPCPGRDCLLPGE
jgi:ELWxxDGT repeat protein